MYKVKLEVSTPILIIYLKKTVRRPMLCFSVINNFRRKSLYYEARRELPHRLVECYVHGLPLELSLTPAGPCHPANPYENN